METTKRLFNNAKLALSKTGIGFVIGRIPSMMFWSVISTGALVGAQYLYFNLLPADYFFTYKSPAHVSNVKLGEKPTLDYCRTSNGDYPIVVDAQVRKVEPPVYTQQYQVMSNIPEGTGCVSREVGEKPTAPGDYKIYYTVEVTLPFGVKKYAKFETTAFNVAVPNTAYGDYSLTVADNDGTNDGQPTYKAGNNLEYAFKAELLVEIFGTTERHLVCGGDDYFIDSYSGRQTAGEKDSVNRTVTIPDGLQGECILELRNVFTVTGSTAAITQTLKSNSFVVQ